MKSKNQLRAGLLILVIVSVGCLLAASELSANAASVDGSGTWRSDALAANGTWNADLSRTDDTIAGGIALTGSATSGGSVSGTITNDAVTFGVIENGEYVARFTGTVTGNSVSGTYTSEVGDHGVWSGTLTTH